MSRLWMVWFSNGWYQNYSWGVAQLFEDKTIWIPIFKKSVFPMVRFQIPTVQLKSVLNSSVKKRDYCQLSIDKTLDIKTGVTTN